MTNEQAIAMISHIKEYIVDNQGDKEYGGALDMAIEALEKQKTFDNGTWVDKDYHDKVYALLQDRYFKALERNRWMPLPEPPETTREDAGHWDGIAPLQEVEG